MDAPVRGSSFAAWRVPPVALLAVVLATPATAAPRGDRDERIMARDAAMRGDHDAATRYWREGPVRYLLNKEEDRVFRKLKSDDERARFIQGFWARRDPAPFTPDNEYRTLFYRRVEEATRGFTESTTPGWKTDRGKIYILLGPPDEMEEPGDRSLPRSSILWTYRDPPPGTGVGANSVIRFVRDLSGEYRLSNHLRLFGGETALGIGLQLQAMQVKSLPEPRELLDAIVNAPPPTDRTPFRTHDDFFASGDGRTLAVLTLGVSESLLRRDTDAGETLPGRPPTPEPSEPESGQRFQAIARLIGDPPGLAVFDLAGESALRRAPGDPVDDPDGYVLFQGAAFVTPGRYTIFYGLVDRATGEIRAFRDAIAVPALDEGVLSVGRVSLASRVDRVAGSAGLRYSAPFVLGDLRAVPHTDDLFRNGQTFAFYFQVTGAARDPIGGHPDLDLVYRLFAARGVGPEGDLLFQPFGNPIHLTRQQGAVHGHALRIEGWPPTTYRLEVDVTDNLNKQRSSGGVTFRVL